jgi:hypothetical protein
MLRGAIVCFGHADESWVLADTSEPEVMAVALDTGEAVLGSQGIIGLPSSSNPQCTLYLNPEGGWQLETADGDTSALSDGQIIDCEGRKFQFCCPNSTAKTAAVDLGASNTEPTLRFVVSSDEDFVELTLEYPNRSVSLGARAQNYLLLTLARQQLADVAADIPPPSCGWVDKEQLADGLRMTPQQVDGEVFRIRRHFSRHGLSEAATILERRPRTKQIRLGFSRVTIERR